MGEKLTPHEFVNRWQSSTLTERSGSQQHFIDLCRMLGQSTPVELDPAGDFYTFEKGLEKGAAGSGKGKGFADVFYRGRFAWEYKGKHKDLDDAYDQLQLYREALENPPLLIVCDMDRYKVHTNFTGMAPAVYSFTNEDLLEEEKRKILRNVFEDPEALRPGRSIERVTREAAEKFARLADGLRERGFDGEEAAAYLDRLLFCLFAEDVGLIPKGIFTEILAATRRDPQLFERYTAELFEAMSGGGNVLLKQIKRFNGGLFEDVSVLPLTSQEISLVAEAAALDWGSVEPAIFGTLFERSLDPGVRVPLGAYYTSREDILAVVEPVLMAPLRREWSETRGQALALYERAQSASGGASSQSGKRTMRKVESLLLGFAEKIRAVTVLDPACGSGNFLYVSLRQLLDLEKQVSTFAGSLGLTPFFPGVSPEQLKGIEKNPFAHELAQVSLWIGYLQWMLQNGFGSPEEPILGPMDNVLLEDAVLGQDKETGELTEPQWPSADVIVGNPPFLGDKRMRSELGGEYVSSLRSLYEGRVSGGADLVTYWFEKARDMIASGRLRRAGLLATNGIRYGENRKVLQRTKGTGDIFFAHSDRAWVLDGAGVRVSMVGFDDGSEETRTLNGESVQQINSDLTALVDVTGALPLYENKGVCFLGVMKAGPFDISEKEAREMLPATNPDGRLNSDAVRPRLGGQNITKRQPGTWIIDFGVDMPIEEAALYEAPFEYVRANVKPLRDNNRRKKMREKWWIHGEARPGLRKALRGLDRCIVTPEVSKHRIFVWMDTETVPDHTLHVIARDDHYTFGILHSKAHELWSLSVGNFMGYGNDPRYNSSRTFGTFPFPRPDQNLSDEIASAANKLSELRVGWLDPPGATDTELKKRTLTNLYNERPSWLAMAHDRLDKVVYAAYDWPDEITDEQILRNLLALNYERSGAVCS